jgi:hypothetical protein
VPSVRLLKTERRRARPESSVDRPFSGRSNAAAETGSLGQEDIRSVAPLSPNNWKPVNDQTPSTSSTNRLQWTQPAFRGWAAPRLLVGPGLESNWG